MGSCLAMVIARIHASALFIALGDYAIPKVYNERRYPYSRNNLFRPWLMASFDTLGHH